MDTTIMPGTVIFTGDHKRLAKFYQTILELDLYFADDTVTVLRSETFELVIHPIRGEVQVSTPPHVREDSYIKPFFAVKSLAEIRETALALGGELRPQSQEWEARGFRACEATDPDGNVIQFREPAS